VRIIRIRILMIIRKYLNWILLVLFTLATFGWFSYSKSILYPEPHLTIQAQHNITTIIKKEVDTEILKYLQDYPKAKYVLEKWQQLQSGGPWEYSITKGVTCGNVGHFYTEHFPNLYRYRDGIKKICTADKVIDSMKALVNEFIPGVVWSQDTKECSENNSPPYSCFMIWACEPIHQQLLFTAQEYWAIYDNLIKHCNATSVPGFADILLMNREGSRRVVNYDALETRINVAGWSTIRITTPQITKMTQCEIFKLYASVRLVIMPYGADQIYPLLLQKKILTFRNKITSEGFWDTIRHKIGRFSDYKTLEVHPSNNITVDEKYGYS